MTGPINAPMRSDSTVIEVILQKVSRVEQSIDALADAVVKLAVVEERQAADRQAIERAFSSIQRSEDRAVAALEKIATRMESADARLDALEAAAPTAALTSGWILDGARAAAVVVIVLVLNRLGIMA